MVEFLNRSFQLRWAVRIVVFAMMTVVMFSGERLSAQTSAADTSHKPLPAIQLQEYTIVGLSRITLPEKNRVTLPLVVRTRWVSNPSLQQKSLPIRVFQFTRKKPTIIIPVETVQFTAQLGYGSFQTFQGDVSFQPRLNRFTPFGQIHYLKSNGHQEGANRSEQGFTMGTNGTLWNGNRTETQLFFNTYEQGLWGNFYQRFGKTTIRHTLQGALIHLGQQFPKGVSLEARGAYREQQHRTLNNTSQSTLEANGQLQYVRNNLSFSIGGAFQHTQTQQTAFYFPPLDSTLFTNTQQLMEGDFYFGHSFKMVNYRIGLRYQRMDSGGTILNNQKVFPFFRIGFLPGNTLQINAGFFSGYRIPDLNRLTGRVIATDLETFSPLYYRSRWELGMHYHPLTQITVTYQFRYATIERIPVVVPSTPVTSGSPALWHLTFASTGNITTHSLQTEATIAQGFLFRAGIHFNTATLDTLPGKQLPYIPQVSGEAALAWNFTSTAQFQLSVKYTGKRFDDLQNNNALSPFLLLNVEGRMQIFHRLYLNVWGKNLLNQTYETWRNFTAPGVHFGASIEFRY